MSLFDLRGKVAIVTGGNGGIGLGMARGLAGAGAGLVIAARNAAKTNKAVAELEADFKIPVLGLGFDLLDPESIEAMVARAEEEMGRIDILVSNAGTNIRKMPDDYSVEEWDTVLGANLRGTFLCARAVHPHLQQAGGGKIICIGSLTSVLSGAKLAPYSASKGGVVQLVRSLAVAYAGDNIQVNAVLPGWINTEMTRQARKDLPGLDEKAQERCPAGRWGEPSDLAGTAVFLASPASDFVTGTALPVDGGYLAML
jgi:2-deoxy-D-gluconate 3-dehydrogenase